MQNHQHCKRFFISGAIVLSACSPSFALSLPSGASAEAQMANTRTVPSTTSHSSDFDIVEGTVRVFDSSQCKDAESPLMMSYGTCFGDNPITPYVMPYFPSAPTEYIDPAYGDVFMADEGTPARSTYRLGLNEAVVTLMDMPPEAAYFGYQTYLFTREQSRYPFFTRFPRLLSRIQSMGLVFSPRTSPNPERFELFASTGNAVNQLRLQNLNQNQAVWGKKVAFVTSASPEVEQKVSDYLRQTYGDEWIIAHEKIDRDHQVGLTKEADDFMTLIRYALPQDKVRGEDWRTHAVDHLRTFRFTLKDSSSALQPFAYQDYDTKTANSEHHLNALVSKVTGVLQSDLAQRYPDKQVRKRLFVPSTISTETFQLFSGVAGLQSSESKTQGAFLQGDFCRKYAFSCLGDSQDTDAYRYLPLNDFSLQTDSFFVGVDHAQTGNATYVSLSFYDRGIFMGLDSNSALPSAYDFVSQLNLLNRFTAQEQTDLKVLTATAIGAPGCAQKYGGMCWEIDETLDANKAYSLIQRAYLRPASQAGADPLLMITPRFLFVN